MTRPPRKPYRPSLPPPTGYCQWYALCTNVAAGTVQHPILGAVPCCTRCRDKHALGDRFTPYGSQ